LRRNNNEWRAYNVNAENKAWPSLAGRHKILLIPGSLNEVWGHSDWSCSWKHPTDAYDALIDQLSLSPADLVLRCHPNWSEKIGKADGHMPEDYYTAWAKEKGIVFISSADRTSTLGLIEQADAVVVSGGSAAIDAGILGKQVIAVGPSSYQEAKICDSALDMHEMTSLKLRTSLEHAEKIGKAALVKKRTLRFLYTIANRIPLYSEYVKCISPTKYVYKDGADGEWLVDLLSTGKLVPKEIEFSENEAGENEILKIAEELRWEELIENSTKEIEYRHIRRRFPYVAMDSVRELMRHGDR
jgi:fructose-specific component phosphotransferase system IIB-like protein